MAYGTEIPECMLTDILTELNKPLFIKVTRYNAKLTVQKSVVCDCNGLFFKGPGKIKAGEIICLYSGDLTAKRFTELSETQQKRTYSAAPVLTDVKCPIPYAQGGGKSCGNTNLAAALKLVGTENTKSIGLGAFANHSANPNAIIYSCNVLTLAAAKQRPYFSVPFLVALKEIQPNDEICWKYPSTALKKHGITEEVSTPKRPVAAKEKMIAAAQPLVLPSTGVVTTHSEPPSPLHSPTKEPPAKLMRRLPVYDIQLAKQQQNEAPEAFFVSENINICCANGHQMFIRYFDAVNDASFECNRCHYEIIIDEIKLGCWHCKKIFIETLGNIRSEKLLICPHCAMEQKFPFAQCGLSFEEFSSC